MRGVCDKELPAKASYNRENDIRVRRGFLVALSVCVMLIAASFTACSGGDTTAPYAGKEVADLGGYSSMVDYDGESRLVETTVEDVLKYMDEKKSFAVFLGYEECEYCNAIMPYLNEAARGADQYVGYIDTRKNPDWQNNSDIDDYDKFVEVFGEYLTDEDGEPYLYTPDLYFIKDGEIVGHHQGLIEGADDPDKALTGDQETALKTVLEGNFSEIK